MLLNRLELGTRERGGGRHSPGTQGISSLVGEVNLWRNSDFTTWQIPYLWCDGSTGEGVTVFCFFVQIDKRNLAWLQTIELGVRRSGL